MKTLTLNVQEQEIESLGNWATAKDLFPIIEVEQKTTVVNITILSIANRKRGQWGKTHEFNTELSSDKQVVRITGMTGLRNDRRQTGGRQKFCFFVFLGDSGHYYTHRSVASKGWSECEPDKLLSKLRRAGLGKSDKNVIQQGDFLLYPANGNSYDDEEFKHETTGAGHHNFEMPVLFATGDRGRQYKLTEPTLLIHTAVDGIQHPSVLIPSGVYSVGATKESLAHSNKRD